ncbi:MAG: hypothetical protein U0165_03310 [Polyangiaceae bacterium]
MNPKQQRSARLAALLGIIGGTAAACASRSSSGPAVVEVTITNTASSADAGANPARPTRTGRARIAAAVPTETARPQGLNNCYNKSGFDENDCLMLEAEELPSRIYSYNNPIARGPVEVHYPYSEYVECCYGIEYNEEPETPILGRPLRVAGRIRTAELVVSIAPMGW